MNKERREFIEKILTKLDELKSDIENTKWDEEDAFESLPDNLKESGRGEAMQEAIDNLDYALDSMDELIDYLNEAQAR